MIKALIALTLAMVALLVIGYIGVFIAFAIVDGIKKER